MHVIVVENAEELARVAAARIAEVIQSKENPVIGVATGSSPVGVYENLAARVEAGTLDTSRVTAFALDEYVGLPVEHPESYHSVIHNRVTVPLKLDPARVHVPDGTAEDLTAACADFERRITEAGGIDLQLLGLGSNGHIGFNEPTSSFASRTRLKTLAPRTRQDNARFFNSLAEVPFHCLTQGLGTILEARRLLLVAQGEGKAEAVAQMIEGPLSSKCPASALQLHPNATVVIDRAASRRLELTDYFEHVVANLPAGHRVRDGVTSLD